MKTLILFGGGDGGGLLITANGIRSIPPFDPAIRYNLKAAAAMVKAVGATSNERTGASMAKHAGTLCNSAIEQLEEVVGPLEGDRSLVYQDEDGGFTCGSTGKPPIPFPWPPNLLPSLPELLRAGVVDPELVTFIKQARDSQIPFTEMFEKPAEIAKKLGVSLSAESAKGLHALAPSQLAAIKDETDREIVGLFHHAVTDGRFIDTWHTRPYEVARELKLSLSDNALERIVSGGAAAVFVGRNADNPVADAGVSIGVVAIAITGIIAVTVAVTAHPVEEMVIDRSRLRKF